MDSCNIFQRINKVMQSVVYVQKDKAISGGGANYRAVTHDQVVSVARAAIVQAGIVIYPEQVSGEFIVKRDVNATPQPVKMGLYSGFYDVHFVNMDKPEDKVTVRINAHANDNGDKAPGKCVTYAVKSAVLKLLFLETGENDESRSDAADVDFITEEQCAILFPLLCSPDGIYTEKGSKIAKAFKFNNITEIKSRRFDQILKAAK